MNCMKSRVVLAFAALIAFQLAADAGSVVSEFPIIPSDEVKRGEWSQNFYEIVPTATVKHIPLFVMTGKSGCEYCLRLETAAATDEFKAWQADKNIYMAMVISDLAGGDAYMSAVEFCKSGPNTLSASQPKAMIYWCKPDGTIMKYNFIGRNKQMAVKQGTLCEQLIGTLDMYLNEWGYDPHAYIGGEFAAGNTIGDRLEAQLGLTEFVDVPLKRSLENSEEVFTNTFVYVMSGEAHTTNVVWGVGETEKSVRINISGGEHLANDRIELSLSDLDEITVLESAITFVERENSPKNPAWIGTRTVDGLKWGEWTMDLDVATNKVAAFNKANPGKRAYTLALVAGGLWCPDCARNDAYVIDTPEFKNWATNHNVACVCIDIPSDPTVGGTCLLNRDVREVSAKYMDADPEHGKYQSGAGYLSRWMISDDDAASVMERNRSLVGVNTLNGGWNRPERANQKRTGVPIFILLREDGAIAGRIETFATTSPDDSTYIDGNIRRLDELLATIDIPDGESDFHPSTTRREMSAQGGSREIVLSGADQAGTVRLTDTVDYAKLVVTADGETSGELSNTLSVYVKKDGVISLVKSVSGAFAGGILSNAVDMTVVGGEYFARLEIAGLGDLSVFGQDAEISSSATVKSAIVFERGEMAFDTESQTVFVPDGDGEVVVSRTGGMYGEASVKVVLSDPGTAEGFYSFSETNLVWASGETGEKAVAFSVFRTDELASGDFTLALNDGKGASVVSPSAHVVTLTDTEDPCFENFDMNVMSWSQFGTEQCFALRNVDTTKAVTIKKTSGSLPKGLKLAYDKKTGEVVLSGTATEPGVYTATYTVTQNRVTGLPATITIVVGDPQEENPFVSVKRDNQIIPLYMRGYGMSGYGQTNVVAGTLTVGITAKNKITAKFQGFASGALSFSGSWNDLSEDGDAVAWMEDRRGNCLVVEMNPEGTLWAFLWPADWQFEPFEPGPIWTSAAPWPSQRYSAWEGYYTVTLVDREPLIDRNEPVGTGYLTLTVNANGSVKWTGMLPNGTSASGSSQLLDTYVDYEEDEVAEVTIFKRSSKDIFGMTLAIKANSDVWYDDVYAQMIHDAPVTTAYLLHTENTYQYITYQSAFGGWYVPNIAPSALCETFGYDPEDITLNFTTEGIAASEKNGELLPICESLLGASDKTISMSQAAEGVTFSFAKKTGLFSGKATLWFANGKSVKGSFAGALLPGWSGCAECVEGRELVDRPFGSGTFYFKDTVNGRSVTRSLPVDLGVTSLDRN